MDDFEAHRPRLHAVATRLLGSRAEADDALQEAWLRVERADTSSVANIGGWLTTVVSRVCLTMLDQRKRRREEALEEGRLPDPVITAPDPEGEALAADAVGAALLVVLETLDPAERLAFVLHDVFAVPFDDIAPILDRSPARLSRGAASVSELAAPLDMSLPSVMGHLDVLQRSGLVRSEKVGRVRRCRLEPGPMRTLEQWIAEHRAIWERHFDRLSDVLDDAFPADQGDRR